MSEFFIQATNLLAQQLAAIKGEEIYALTACMDPELRELIAVLRAMADLNPKVKGPINKLFPIIEALAKARWQRTELTDLGLRVGQRNIEEITDSEVIDDADKP